MQSKVPKLSEIFVKKRLIYLDINTQLIRHVSGGSFKQKIICLINEHCNKIMNQRTLNFTVPDPQADPFHS